jgi:hypothetical protein
MTKEKTGICRVILNYLAISSDACEQENLINFLTVQRGYKREDISEMLNQLVNYKLIVLYKQETETLLYLTLDGNQASEIGLSAYINTKHSKNIVYKAKIAPILNFLKELK